MIMGYADPFETLFAFQRALESRLSSDWLGSTTASTGAYPPVNVFQQGDDLVAIVELPGVNKEDLNIQAKENTIRIAGRKAIDHPEGVSLHRRERVSGVFDRTLVVPMQIDPNGIKPITTTACWRCLSPAPSRTSREPLRSNSQVGSSIVAGQQELPVQQKREVDKAQEPTTPMRAFLPTTDIFETEDTLTVVLEMPGVDRDNIDVNVENGVLTVEGKINFSKYEGLQPIYSEYNIGPYRRTFRISSRVDQDKIRAELRDGVVTLVLPKAEEAKPRRIEVK